MANASTKGAEHEPEPSDVSPIQEIMASEPRDCVSLSQEDVYYLNELAKNRRRHRQSWLWTSRGTPKSGCCCVNFVASRSAVSYPHPPAQQVATVCEYRPAQRQMRREPSPTRFWPPTTIQMPQSRTGPKRRTRKAS